MYVKHLFKYIAGIIMLAMVAASADAQDFTPIPVQGKIYEGNLQGMAVFTFEFNSENNVIFTMSYLGQKQSANCTYEQNGSQIVVHAQKGDMTLNQTENNVLSMKQNGVTIHLMCQTPDTEQDKIVDVIGHVFSGTFGNNGRLKLAFLANGLVEVSVINGYQQQKENWPYIQDGDTITLVEPMGRKITLKLNGDNSLKGMFTIVYVTLSLVQ